MGPSDASHPAEPIGASFDVRKRRFISALEHRLGPQGVRCDEEFLAHYGRDVSGFVRQIAAVLFPTSTADVTSCIQAAIEHGMTLYPVSSGKNFGLGSALPVRSGAMVLDLRGMNRIRNLDREHGYAVVEPGVTQRMLYQRLKEESAPFLLNVTGAPADHSIIGNALERGVGMIEAQVDVVTVAEVVLGTGMVLGGSLPAAKARWLYPPGIGPDLNGLFFQSNLGIVTAARVQLLPRPEVLAHLFCSVDDAAQFPRMVDRLADLRRRGVLDAGLHLANGARSQATLRPVLLDSLRAQGWRVDAEAERVAEEILRRNRSAWSATTSLRGSSRRIKDSWRQTRSALRGIAKVRLLTEPRRELFRRATRALRFLPAVRKQRALLDALEPLLGLQAGIPSDSPLACTFPDHPADPCTSRRGLLFGLLLVPLDGTSLAEVAQIAEAAFQEHGFPLYMTFNSMARDAAECVLTLLFDRSADGEPARARRCMESVTREAARLGYPPYRVGIEGMEQAVDRQNPFWQAIEELKRACDPHHVIAPGRYNAV